MTHFKAHGLAGFGGAIKNLGMGCAPSAGKMDQHKGMKLIVDAQWCIACGACFEARPQAAITMEGDLRIDYDLCVGCGECIPICMNSSIGYDWKHDPPAVYRDADRIRLSRHHGQARRGYFNCLLQITPDCDCVPWSDAPIVPDVGLLASTDPVAIDAASLELVNQQQGLRGTRLANNLQPGQDKFKGVWGETQGTIQITYGEEIALGTSSYDLVELWHTRLQDKTPPLSQPRAPALPYQASQNGADIPSCG